MEALLENLTTNEAAIAAGVTVAKINRVIDRKILRRGSTAHPKAEPCAKTLVSGLRLFETAEWLTAAASARAIRNGLVRDRSWLERRTAGWRNHALFRFIHSHLGGC